MADPAKTAEVLARVRRWSRVLIACELSGIATRCVEKAVEYAKQRQQFGRAIGSYQAIKHLLADIHTDAVSLHNFCEAVAGDLDELDDAEADLSAAALKAHAATVAVSVCEGAIQVHGESASPPRPTSTGTTSEPSRCGRGTATAWSWRNRSERWCWTSRRHQHGRSKGSERWSPHC